MLIRILSGLAALAVLFPAAWFGGWWFAALAFPVVGVCLYEWFGMTLPGDLLGRWVGVGLGLGLAFAVTSGHASGEAGLGVMVGVLLLPLLFFLLRPGDTPTAGSRAALMVTGVLWLGGLGGVATSLDFLHGGFGWLILAAVLAFGSDVGGYFVGRAIGRTPLYPKISPKKTLEGSLGGVVLATALAFPFSAAFGPDLAPGHLLVIAPLGAALGQLGDLCQSLLKRSMGVKDSGAIMPGHGGLFDRIDSLLFVGPPMFLYARWVLGVEVTWLPS